MSSSTMDVPRFSSLVAEMLGLRTSSTLLLSEAGALKPFARCSDDPCEG